MEDRSWKKNAVDLFRGRPAVIATMHGKERALRPGLSSLKLTWCSQPMVDTDKLGTFSGEIRRKKTVRDTLIKKATLGLKHSEAEIAVATEATFGPHPLMPFVPAHIEHIILLDRLHKWTITDGLLEADTNYAWIESNQREKLDAFLNKITFKQNDQAVVIRPANRIFQAKKWIQKGICDRDEARSFAAYLSNKKFISEIHIETDMRAHLNKKRMQVIERLARQFSEKLHEACPLCDAPGFMKTGGEPGLPCASCGNATQNTLNERWECHACCHQQIREREDGKQSVPAMYCEWCNP